MRLGGGHEEGMGPVRDCSVERSWTEGESLSDICEEQVAFDFSFQCYFCDQGRRERDISDSSDDKDRGARLLLPTTADELFHSELTATHLAFLH